MELVATSRKLLLPLQPFSGPSDIDYAANAVVPPDRLARSLVDAAVALHRLGLWHVVPADTPVLVHVPGESHPVVVTVIGHLGSDYGIFIARGERALEQFRRYIATNAQTFGELDVLSVSMDPLGTIPAEHRGILTAAGIQARRETLVPCFFAASGGSEDLRVPNRRDQRLLLAVMRGLIRAHASGELRVVELDGPAAQLLEITVEGEGRELETRTQRLPWGLPPLAPSAVGLDVPADLPVNDERWIAVAVGESEFPDEEFEGKRLVFLGDEATGCLIDRRLVPLDSGPELLELFSAAFRGDSDGSHFGFPAEISFSGKNLFDEVSPALEAVGVRCRLVDEHATIDIALSKFKNGGGQRSGRDPLPSTLNGWKAADIRFTRELCALVDDEHLSIGRAMARFFGSEDLGAEVLGELGRLQPIASFMEWRMADYRPTARSKTFLEKRLRDKRLTRAERTLIEARIDARVSIYRVVAARPGEAIDLEDIFDGAKFTVQELKMSTCDMVGWFLPLRIMTVAEWRFIASAGPPLNPMLVDRAVDYLEAVGVGLSADRIRRHTHVLGWLWSMLLPRNQRMPKLCNTDGDPLLWHTATFQLADIDAVVRSLNTRERVRVDEADCEWTWWRPGGPSPGFGDNTTLARLQIIDTHLIVEANSAARFAGARKWIEVLPGVRFERVTTKPMTGPSARHLDDQLPGKPEAVSQGMIQAMKRLHHEACRNWLDQNVPALGNRTPRQASKSEEGRRKVAVMIRTMVAASSPSGPLEPPREELLRELGISSLSE